MRSVHTRLDSTNTRARASFVDPACSSEGSKRRGQVLDTIGGSEDTSMAEIQIAVINASTAVSDDEVRTAAAALQIQVRRDFAPAWGIDADLTVVPRGETPEAGAWWLVILDTSDSAGALGYHDLTPEGLPLAKVFAQSALKLGFQWTITASHELLEMLADPDVV